MQTSCACMMKIQQCIKNVWHGRAWRTYNWLTITSPTLMSYVRCSSPAPSKRYMRLCRKQGRGTWIQTYADTVCMIVGTPCMLVFKCIRYVCEVYSETRVCVRAPHRKYNKGQEEKIREGAWAQPKRIQLVFHVIASMRK
jgi:hypothetical protein